MSDSLLFFIDLAARSAVILGLAWLAAGILPRLSSATRYWIWFVALCTLPLLPLATALVPSVTLVTVSPPLETLSQPATEPPLSAPAAATPPPAVEPPAAQPSPATPPATAPPSQRAPGNPESDHSPVIAIYTLVAFGLLVPLGVGLFRLRKWHRRARPIERGIPSAIPEDIDIRTSPEISIPLTWGTRRPVILLPESAARWSDDRLAVVLAHESAHIARRDFATGLAATVIRAAFWFQPLAWMAHRKLQTEREIACDDRVLQSKASTPPDYAEHLHEVVKGAAARGTVAVAMARPAEILGRVRAILDSARNRASVGKGAKLKIALLSLAFLSPLAFVRCAGEKAPDANADSEIHETGIGIVLRPVDPRGFTFMADGEKVMEVPDGPAFSMAEHEVTQAEFQQLMGHNPSGTKAAHLPVDRVTWQEAAAFCKALTERDRTDAKLPEGMIYRLPTFREWLVAAAPGGLLPTGDALEAVAWHADNSAGLLHPVAAKQANAYGLHDILGNAAEWAAPSPELGGSGKTVPVQYLGQCVLQLVGASETESYDRHLQTQFAVIRAKATLRRAAKQLNLREHWGLETEDEVEARLGESLSVESVRGTDLVNIDVMDDDPIDAMRIANAVANAYRSRLREQQATSDSKALLALETQIAAQEDMVVKRRERMLDLMKQYQITDLGSGTPTWMRGDPPPEGANAVPPPAEDSIEEKRKSIEYVEAKKDYELARDLLNTLKEQLAKQAVELRMPREDALVHELATPALTPRRETGTFDRYLAMGGRAGDPPDQWDEAATDGNQEGRTDGVGFRFVMADE